MLDITNYGGKGDDHTDNTPALNDAVAAILQLRNDYTIYFPAGKYRFASRPNSFPIGIKLVGNGPVGSSELGTLLLSDYDEPDGEAAFLCWDGSEAFHGTGGGLQDIAIMKNYGRMGGNGVKLLGTDAGHRCGFWEGRNLMISGLNYDRPAQGAWHRCLLVDGCAITNPGGMGMRDTSLCWWNFSKATIATAEVRGATHFFATNGQIYDGGAGPARFLVTGRGGTNQQSIDVHFANSSFWGELVFDYVNIFTVSGGMASTLTVTSNAKNGLVQTLTNTNAAHNQGTNVEMHIVGLQ
jgi:hypothetical protein